ncbi:MAG: regulatory iron-sulfur-containing complex subunit RicT [Candidatus Marinimicrobia bacterium]|nr:regulatory iron-sulfur-containing complex subunit RicT [Candidatus Neomarinimicrobiota bacterium]
MTRYMQHNHESFGDSGPKPSKYFKVSFKGNRRETYLNPNNLKLRSGDYVIVETELGEDIGIVTPVCNKTSGCNRSPSAEPEFNNRKHGEAIRELIRKASDKEIGVYHSNRRDEPRVFTKGLELISKNKLNMKLIDVEYQLDRRKMTFFYTAEERVDFRQLVKDLAYVFRTRIEMRQIGVRDYARRLDGQGPCGQQICCSRFMDGFEPVTTQYAKDQNLPINPSKLSGACGKLKCCLRFEWDFYHESMKDFPSVGVPLVTADGPGTLVSNDILNRRCTVYLEQGRTEIYDLKTIKKALKHMDSDNKARKN